MSLDAVVSRVVVASSSTASFRIVVLALATSLASAGMRECFRERNFEMNVEHDYYCDCYFRCRLFRSSSGSHVLPVLNFCPDGLFFSRRSGGCVERESSECPFGGRVVPTSEVSEENRRNAMYSSSETPWLRPELPTDSTCETAPNGTRLPIRYEPNVVAFQKDCALYHLCENGRSLLRRCVCGSFDHGTRSCASSVPERVCWDSESYRERLLKEPCSSSLPYCTDVRDATGGGAPSSTSRPVSIATTTSEPSDPCRGREDGDPLPYPRDARFYVECRGGRTAALRRCESGLLFDPVKLFCNYPRREEARWTVVSV